MGAPKAQRKSFLLTEDIRSSQLAEFLTKVATSAKTSNVDHYFRSGEVKGHQNLMELGEHFLRIAMGFEQDEFIPCITAPDFPNYVPQSEDYYPWALFLAESHESDLDEVFHRRALNYLHSDSAGRKNYAVITNFKEIGVYNLKHAVDSYSISLSNLYDSIQHNSNEDSSENALECWQTFLMDFGPDSSKEKKKQRRADVFKYVEPKDDRLGFVKRFGHMPNFEKPIGWDGKDFKETFKTKNLPFLTTENISWDTNNKTIDNKIIWGDNLSIMRSLPSNSIDLIYIDPPFFSGKDYNKIFGDDDEVRTFSDIWDGGLPTYLAWLNARLWEMKRLLKPTGSIVVHLDWHACHYVKVEMDKIFGYGGDKDKAGFRNEIVWHYFMGGKPKSFFARKHDVLLWYSKSEDWKFNYQTSWRRLDKKPSMKSHKGIKEENGNWYSEVGMDDVWDISGVFNMANEFIGYPTQKPEALLERIIESLTDKGDVVADFFSGGGTTISVAEKLNRRWIGCDISRVAVSVARDRMQSVYDKVAGIKVRAHKPSSGFSIQNHGAYDKSQVRVLKADDHIGFILQCYEAIPLKKGEYIHGFKKEKAIHVGPPKGKITADLIEEFHVELSHKKINGGIILAWSWDKEAEEYIKELRNGNHGPEIQLVQVKLVEIDSHEFRGDNIRFLNKPAAVISTPKALGKLNFLFDGTSSQGRNGTDIHYYQWDFNYNGRFSPMTKPNFTKDKDGDNNPLNDNRKVEYEFPAEGKYKVALRIIDKSGAEDTHYIEFDTNQSRMKKGA